MKHKLFDKNKLFDKSKLFDKNKLFDKQKLSLILVFASLIAVTIFGCLTAPDTFKNSGDQGGSDDFVIDGGDNYDEWFESDWPDDGNDQVEEDKDNSKKDDGTVVWESDKNKNKTTASSTKTTVNNKTTTSSSTKKTSTSSTTNKKPSSSTTVNKKPSSSGTTNNNTTKPTEPENKPDDDNNNNNNNNNDNPGKDPVPEDTMKWPDNTYTNLVPKPARGTVLQYELKDGIFCILMTGADMVDAKTYAASLINAGYTSDITETIENNNYLFGGGNAAGSFVVISYQSGQFIIGIEK